MVGTGMTQIISEDDDDENKEEFKEQNAAFLPSSASSFQNPEESKNDEEQKKSEKIIEIPTKLQSYVRSRVKGIINDVPTKEQIKEITYALQQYQNEYNKRKQEYDLTFFQLQLEGNIKNQEA